MKLLLVLAPTLGLAVDVLAHLLAIWVLRVPGLHRRMACAAAAGLAATITVSTFAAEPLNLTAGTARAYLAFNALTFLILAFGYFNLVQMNISSLRLRVANELSVVPAGVSAERLLATYGGRAIVDMRLERLTRGGQITLRDGRYHHRLSGVYLIAVAMDTMKRIVFGRRIRDAFVRAGRTHAATSAATAAPTAPPEPGQG